MSAYPERLTLAQRRMLEDIAETGLPERGAGWTSHSQRRLDSLVSRGLVGYEGEGRWGLCKRWVPSDDSPVPSDRRSGGANDA